MDAEAGRRAAAFAEAAASALVDARRVVAPADSGRAAGFAATTRFAAPAGAGRTLANPGAMALAKAGTVVSIRSRSLAREEISACRFRSRAMSSGVKRPRCT